MRWFERIKCIMNTKGMAWHFAGTRLTGSPWPSWRPWEGTPPPEQKLRGLSKARAWRASSPCPALGLAHQPLSHPKSFQSYGLGSSQGASEFVNQITPMSPPTSPLTNTQSFPWCPAQKQCSTVGALIRWEDPAGRVPNCPLLTSLFFSADGGELGGETVGYTSFHRSSKNSPSPRGWYVPNKSLCSYLDLN